MTINTRLVAAKIINEVTDGRSLTDSLDAHLSQIKDSRDRAFVQALCYGVCRYYPRLDVALSHLLKKPMQEKDSLIHALLLVGLYQLMEMRVPEHAAVAETVNGVKEKWQRGLVNAILREYLRSQENIANKINKDEEATYMHPAWWITTIKKVWPHAWQAILSANNQHPPFALRVNQQKFSRDNYLTELKNNNISAQIIPQTSHGILLNEAITVENLPNFFAGAATIQDGAAQLAAEILVNIKHPSFTRILDACAAPGGKLTHILELFLTTNLQHGSFNPMFRFF